MDEFSFVPGTNRSAERRREKSNPGKIGEEKN